MSLAKCAKSVYVFKAENGLVKVGITNDIAQRLHKFRAESPVHIDLLFYFDDDDALNTEQMIHRSFSDKRHHGEWFSLSAQDIEWIRGQGSPKHLPSSQGGIRCYVRAIKSGKLGYIGPCSNCGSHGHLARTDTGLRLKCRFCGEITEFEHPVSHSPRQDVVDRETVAAEVE